MGHSQSYDLRNKEKDREDQGTVRGIRRVSKENQPDAQFSTDNSDDIREEELRERIRSEQLRFREQELESLRIRQHEKREPIIDAYGQSHSPAQASVYSEFNHYDSQKSPSTTTYFTLKPWTEVNDGRILDLSTIPRHHYEEVPEEPSPVFPRRQTQNQKTSSDFPPQSPVFSGRLSPLPRQEEVDPHPMPRYIPAMSPRYDQVPTEHYQKTTTVTTYTISRPLAPSNPKPVPDNPKPRVVPGRYDQVPDSPRSSRRVPSQTYNIPVSVEASQPKDRVVQHYPKPNSVQTEDRSLPKARLVQSNPQSSIRRRYDRVPISPRSSSSTLSRRTGHVPVETSQPKERAVQNYPKPNSVKTEDRSVPNYPKSRAVQSPQSNPKPRPQSSQTSYPADPDSPRSSRRVPAQPSQAYDIPVTVDTSHPSRYDQVPFSPRSSASTFSQRPRRVPVETSHLVQTKERAVQNYPNSVHSVQTKPTHPSRYGQVPADQDSRVPVQPSQAYNIPVTVETTSHPSRYDQVPFSPRSSASTFSPRVPVETSHPVQPKERVVQSVQTKPKHPSRYNQVPADPDSRVPVQPSQAYSIPVTVETTSHPSRYDQVPFSPRSSSSTLSPRLPVETSYPVQTKERVVPQRSEVSQPSHRSSQASYSIPSSTLSPRVPVETSYPVQTKERGSQASQLSPRSSQSGSTLSRRSRHVPVQPSHTYPQRSQASSYSTSSRRPAPRNVQPSQAYNIPVTVETSHPRHVPVRTSPRVPPPPIHVTSRQDEVPHVPVYLDKSNEKVLESSLDDGETTTTTTISRYRKVSVFKTYEAPPQPKLQKDVPLSKRRPKSPPQVEVYSFSSKKPMNYDGPMDKITIYRKSIPDTTRSSTSSQSSRGTFTSDGSSGTVTPTPSRSRQSSVASQGIPVTPLHREVSQNTLGRYVTRSDPPSDESVISVIPARSRDVQNVPSPQNLNRYVSRSGPIYADPPSDESVISVIPARSNPLEVLRRESDVPNVPFDSRSRPIYDDPPEGPREASETGSIYSDFSSDDDDESIKAPVPRSRRSAAPLEVLSKDLEVPKVPLDHFVHPPSPFLSQRTTPLRKEVSGRYSELPQEEGSVASRRLSSERSMHLLRRHSDPPTILLDHCLARSYPAIPQDAPSQYSIGRSLAKRLNIYKEPERSRRTSYSLQPEKPQMDPSLVEGSKIYRDPSPNSSSRRTSYSLQSEKPRKDPLDQPYPTHPSSRRTSYSLQQEKPLKDPLDQPYPTHPSSRRTSHSLQSEKPRRDPYPTYPSSRSSRRTRGTQTQTLGRRSQVLHLTPLVPLQTRYYISSPFYTSLFSADAPSDSPTHLSEIHAEKRMVVGIDEPVTYVTIATSSIADAEKLHRHPEVGRHPILVLPSQTSYENALKGTSDDVAKCNVENCTHVEVKDSPVVERKRVTSQGSENKIRLNIFVDENDQENIVDVANDDDVKRYSSQSTKSLEEKLYYNSHLPTISLRRRPIVSFYDKLH